MTEKLYYNDMYGREFDASVISVDLVVFTSESSDCKYCKDTISLVDEVGALSDKINIVKYVYEKDKEMVEKYGNRQPEKPGFYPWNWNNIPLY